ncbi:dephospho-CoA kinase [soil metagenome]
MIKLGLTGSIGMGKSTTARLFADEGVPVYDSDAAVHALYAAGGGAVAAVEAAFPGVVGPDGAVDRALLSARVVGDPEALKRLEMTVHPLMGAHRAAFFDETAHARVVVLDVPLLFETGGDAAMDAVAVVSAPADEQRRRVLARPGMTPQKLDAILARQMPDAGKRALADFVIETGEGIEPARLEVRAILEALADPAWRSTRAVSQAPPDA